VRYKNDAAPGGNKAKLLLADGSAIDLNEAGNGRISKQGNAQITKQSGGLVYDLSKISKTAPVIFNTLITPKGGQYQLTLSDGTKVWLNAASSLRFPTAFTGNGRKVILSGEAYFEVAKNNAMPFEVQVNGMTVKVLGTHFDVMAYGDENKVVTTLLEGAVKISKGNASAVLQPGQQATLNNSGNIAVDAADMEKAVAWKNGLFEFNDDNIEMIMRQLARWYDMEVKYEGDMQDKDFTGSIPRGSNLSEVLNMLALTGILQFRIEGKYITVQAH
jgi:ferric-dicitrate binding protein FerR (iron transport regulator)